MARICIQHVKLGSSCSPGVSDLTSLASYSHGGHSHASTCGRCCAKGIKKVAIRTVDTDVVVLAVASFNMSWWALDSSWYCMNLAFGTTLSIFHALTGFPRCSRSEIDSSLASLGIHKSSSKASVNSWNTFHISKAVFFPLPAIFADGEKKTAWEIWKVLSEVTDAFEELLCMPSDVS